MSAALRGAVVSACLLLAATPAAAEGVVFVNAEASQITNYGTTTTTQKSGQDRDLPGGITSGYASETIVDGISSYANLATGKVGLLVDNEGYEGKVKAGFGDQLQFHVEGADANTLTPIGVTLHFEGDIYGTANSNYQFKIEEGPDSPYWASVNFAAAKNLQNVGSMSVSAYGAWTNTPAHTQATFPGSEGTTGSFSTTYTYTYYFNLRGADPLMNLRLTADAFASYGSVAAFNNTGSISFILPETVTFTSDSGTFLSAAVPEPSSWALMIAGFGAIGAMMRRRRAVAA